jgi:AraC-like DNA-binding protein
MGREPKPTDAELLTLAVAQVLLGIHSEAPPAAQRPGASAPAPSPTCPANPATTSACTRPCRRSNKRSGRRPPTPTCGPTRRRWWTPRRSSAAAPAPLPSVRTWPDGPATAIAAPTPAGSGACAWLTDLPKPVGVLACYDIAGQEVLEACKIAGLAVPDAVAVIGVDNDELIDNLTTPPMSSIEPNTTATGYLAAHLLDLMMQGLTVEPGLRLIEPTRIVTRQSSDIFAVDDPLVSKALRFIRARSDQNLAVDAVLRHVGLSRRALDYRFAATLGRTVHSEIIRVRMGHVAELLSSTDWTVQQISERLNFSHAEYMSFAFKKHTGQSPGQYRRTVNGSVARQAFWQE